MTGPAYLAPLDGVRAAAVLLVLVSHTVIFGEFPRLHAPGLMGGYVGICLFFVLSGYLITRLLIREEDRFGDVSLKDFYLRRAFRLFPALWLYLAVVFVLWVRGLMPELPWYGFLTSLFYLRNLIGRLDATAHLWSLSVEEQFYLLWPAVFVLLAGRGGLRLAVAAGVVGAVVAWRGVAWDRGLATIGHLYIRSDFRFDSPLIGCALALTERLRPGLVGALNRTPGRSDLALAAGAAGLCGWVAYQIEYGQAWGVDSTVTAALCGLVVGSQVGPGGGLGGRVFAAPPLVFLGKISYGVYLWQGLFMGPPEGVFGGVRRFPWNWAATLAAALASYFLLEKPLLRYKDRTFHRRPAPAAGGAPGGNPR